MPLSHKTHLTKGLEENDTSYSHFLSAFGSCNTETAHQDSIPELNGQADTTKPVLTAIEQTLADNEIFSSGNKLGNRGGGIYILPGAPVIPGDRDLGTPPWHHPNSHELDNEPLPSAHWQRA
ncbi:hypothetical protein CHU98_g8375 [Xylaria longipes]|nr:hypothetical protein CHU98_g8375 [Xylaria longipes]